MSRNEYEEIESVALAAMIGLLSSNGDTEPSALAARAFDVAETFRAEQLSRIGKKPGYDD